MVRVLNCLLDVGGGLDQIGGQHDVINKVAVVSEF